MPPVGRWVRGAVGRHVGGWLQAKISAAELAVKAVIEVVALAVVVLVTI
jgi:hypothetical protein